MLVRVRSKFCTQQLQHIVDLAQSHWQSSACPFDVQHFVKWVNVTPPIYSTIWFVVLDHFGLLWRYTIRCASNILLDVFTRCAMLYTASHELHLLRSKNMKKKNQITSTINQLVFSWWSHQRNRHSHTHARRRFLSPEMEVVMMKLRETTPTTTTNS